MIKKIIFLILVFILIAGGLIFIFKSKQDVTSDNKIKITTSFYPLYFFANQITGNKAQIINITPAGAEPHDYEPTPQNIIQIESSKLLIMNGGVEPWADKIKIELKNKDIKILEVENDLLTQKIVDPHIWLDPIIAQKITDKITGEIISIDPDNKLTYQNNSSKLKNELTKLDGEFRDGLKNCSKHDFVTSHAAFGYLASEYGLKQISIAGLTPDSEPSLKDLASISNFARENSIKYIFFESLVSPKLSQTIANEIGAKTLVLNPLEGLTDDEIKTGKNYLTVMGENLQNLRVALECK